MRIVLGLCMFRSIVMHLPLFSREERFAILGPPLSLGSYRVVVSTYDVRDVAQSASTSYRLSVDAEPHLLVHVGVGIGRDLDASPLYTRF